MSCNASDIFTNIRYTIKEVVAYYILQHNRKDLYNYKTIDTILNEINSILNKHLLENGLYVDVKVKKLMINY